MEGEVRVNIKIKGYRNPKKGDIICIGNELHICEYDMNAPQLILLESSEATVREAVALKIEERLKGIYYDLKKHCDR